MKQSQGPIERGKQIVPSHYSLFLVLTLQFRLKRLDVPIAKISPEELIDMLSGLVESVVRQCRVDGARERRQPSKEPFIHQRHRSAISVRRLRAHFRSPQLFHLPPTLLKPVPIHEHTPPRLP